MVIAVVPCDNMHHDSFGRDHSYVTETMRRRRRRKLHARGKAMGRELLTLLHSNDCRYSRAMLLANRSTWKTIDISVDVGDGTVAPCDEVGGLVTAPEDKNCSGCMAMSLVVAPEDKSANLACASILNDHESANANDDTSVAVALDDSSNNLLCTSVLEVSPLGACQRAGLASTCP